MVATPRVRLQVEGTEEAARVLGRWATKLHEPAPAFNEMLDLLASEQKDWFASQGEGTWKPLSEPYRTWKKRKFPKRKILHGPDTRGHRGLQLRDQLTKRPFGFERINNAGFTYGSTLEYAPYHQTGFGNMPARKPLKPLTSATIRRLERILQTHVVGQTIEGNR